MMEYKSELKELIGNVPLYKATANGNENETIRLLIRPLIEALGWTNPLDTQGEYSNDVGRADIVVMYEGEPTIVVECKPVGDPLREGRTTGQLWEYFAAIAPSQFGILTNGLRYKFYTAQNGSTAMDMEPFLEIDLEELVNVEDDVFDTDTDVEALAIFAKSGFNPAVTAAAAVKMKSKRGIKQFLSRQFSGQPDETFIRFVGEQVGVRNLRRGEGNSLTEFAVLTSEAINEAIKDHLQQPPVDGISGTTKDEVEGYHVVKNILWNVTDAVFMNDNQGYCSIQLDQNQKSRTIVCRLRFNDAQRKQIGLLDTASEERVSIDSVGEINRYAERIRARARQLL